METPNKILDKLKSVGFIETAQINMQNCKYDYQYLYILQKPS
jgi:predicted transcriptional regulator